MNLSSVFSSDWFLYEMCKCLPPSYYLYFHLSNDRIKEIMINKIEFNLRIKLNDKYGLFIKMVEELNQEIYGKFIIHYLWDDFVDDIKINIKTRGDNIERVLRYVDLLNDTNIYHEKEIKYIKKHFMYEWYYGDWVRDDIHLFITNHRKYNWNFHPILRNSITVLNGKLDLKIKDLKSVVTKRIEIDLNQGRKYDLDEVVDIKGINIVVKPIGMFIRSGFNKYPIL